MNARKKMHFPCYYFLFLVVVHAPITGNNSMQIFLWHESREFPASTKTISCLAMTLQVNCWVKLQSQELFRNSSTKHWLWLLLFPLWSYRNLQIILRPSKYNKKEFFPETNASNPKNKIYSQVTILSGLTANVTLDLRHLCLVVLTFSPLLYIGILSWKIFHFAEFWMYP